MAKVTTVNDLLKMELRIPEYQRPYKWDVQNVRNLILDIEGIIDDYGQYRGKSRNFKYRIGTVILHKTEKNDYDIVDGQQRIISLVLIKRCLGENFPTWIMGKRFFDKTSQFNIHRNYEFIDEYFSLKSEEVKRKFKAVLNNTLEVVVISVEKLEEAFQLFDSQNSRGKSLDPHDLLKAYHLREMRELPYEMIDAVTKWEAKDTRKIKELFDLYLFPILNWSRGNDAKPFTAKDIDVYKGIPANSAYSYARRANKAMPCFQICEPFTSGYEFFQMVDHYIGLLKTIDLEIINNDNFSEIKSVLTDYRWVETLSDFENVKFESAGFCQVKNLFYCVLLFYYDKFHNFDEIVVKKLFSWAFMLRVDMDRLGFDSVNKYAIGGEGSKYTNVIRMFLEINHARMHYEISSLQVKLSVKQLKLSSYSKIQPMQMKRKGLYEMLKKN